MATVRTITRSRRGRDAMTATTSSGRGRSAPLGSLPLTAMLKEFGVTGTKNYSGILLDEYLPQLGFYNAPTVYNQMRRSDGTVAALLAAYSMPLRAAKWYIQPASDDPQAVEMADFIHDNLWNFGSQTFDDFMREAMTFLPFGFAWFEKIFDYIEDGDFTGKLGWYKFAFRYQNTRYRYNTNLVTGPFGTRHRELVSVTQFAPPDYQMTDIPVDKIFLLSHMKEGDNFDGISLLRPAYKHWYFKDKMYALQAIGLERSAVGVPYAKYLQHVDPATIAVITQMIENLRVDDQASIQFDGNEVEIGYLVNHFDHVGLMGAIDHHDGEIMKAGLAQFVNLGTRSTGATGSYALSQDQSQMFLDALNGEANYFASAFHLQNTMQLLRWNYAGVAPQLFPRLAHGDIGERSSVKLAQSLNAFAQYGFVTPDPNTENTLREFLDLPPRDEDWHLMQVMQALAQSPYPEGDDPTDRSTVPIPTITPPGAGTNPAGMPQTGNGIGAGTKGGQGVQNGTAKKAGMRTPSLNNTQVGSRPQGGLRASEIIKLREEAKEVMFDELHRLANEAINHRPEKPSIRMARMRRPYVIRGHEHEQKVNA